MGADEHHEPRWHGWWRIGFGAFLALTLVVGVYLSIWTGQPAQVPGDAAAPEPAATDEAEDPVETAGDPEPEPADDPTEEPTEDPAELIAAAGDPEDTTVQVLDAGAGGAAAGEATRALEEFGYLVVNVTSARGDTAVTTVLFTAGSDAEAAALRARDPRFAQIDENDRFSDGVDLHVLVGRDWR